MTNSSSKESRSSSLHTETEKNYPKIDLLEFDTSPKTLLKNKISKLEKKGSLTSFETSTLKSLKRMLINNDFSVVDGSNSLSDSISDSSLDSSSSGSI